MQQRMGRQYNTGSNGGGISSSTLSPQNNISMTNNQQTSSSPQQAAVNYTNNNNNSQGSLLCNNGFVVGGGSDKIDYDFFEQNYCKHAKEKGSLYTWGSGEMGQLGYSNKIIQQMPKDRDGYPFQPYPLEIDQLKDKGVYQIAGGDGHTVAVDIRGNVYSWGASACGQLGLPSMRDLPTDIEGYPYQPTPRLIDLLQNIRVVQIVCGDAHTVALTREGRLYSWGGGGCGQLGHPDTSSMPKDEDGCPYQPRPKLIVALRQHEVKEVSCGKAHTVAVLSNGHLYSWGAGACGQLGHPDTSSFPADEDGYPYQPIPRCVTALKNLKLIRASCGDVHTMVLTENGEIYCFGGGSCGQLGFGDIFKMPLDVDRCPFMPVPKKIESLQGHVITQLACGDSHSMALTKEGLVFAWGEATLGQLGLDEIRDLPKNTENKPYQPYPTLVASLTNKRIVAISCGETHTLALTDSGHLYSFGANGCGQLGQFQKEFDRRRRGSYEEIVFPKITNSMMCDGTPGQSSSSFMMSNGFESSNESPRAALDSSLAVNNLNDTNNLHLQQSNQRHHHNQNNNQQSSNVAMASSSSPLLSPPPVHSANDYGIETICYSPMLVKSLMHRKVIRISSGGVHNICIVESKPYCILKDVYMAFMNGRFTDVIFTGFYTTKATNSAANQQYNSSNMQHSYHHHAQQHNANGSSNQINGRQGGYLQGNSGGGDGMDIADEKVPFVGVPVRSGSRQSNENENENNYSDEEMMQTRDEINDVDSSEGTGTNGVGFSSHHTLDQNSDSPHHHHQTIHSGTAIGTISSGHHHHQSRRLGGTHGGKSTREGLSSNPNGNGQHFAGNNNSSTSSGSNQTRMAAQSESFWRDKPRQACSKQIQAHIPVIATKSEYFQKIFAEKIALKKSKDEKLVIDFGGQVQFEAFRKIVDFFYLNDLHVLDNVTDSHEILELIKLAKLYKLDSLFKAAEAYFQDIMYLWFENYSVFSLKLNKIAHLNKQGRRGGADQLAIKNKGSRHCVEDKSDEDGTLGGVGQAQNSELRELTGRNMGSPIPGGESRQPYPSASLEQSASLHAISAENGQQNSPNLALLASRHRTSAQTSQTSQLQQSSVGQIVANKRRKISQRAKNMLQGMMFLPDGRVLIMDNDLYRNTIQNSIVLDLLESSNNSSTSTTIAQSTTPNAIITTSEQSLTHGTISPSPQSQSSQQQSSSFNNNNTTTNVANNNRSNVVGVPRLQEINMTFGGGQNQNQNGNGMGSEGGSNLQEIVQSATNNPQNNTESHHTNPLSSSAASHSGNSNPNPTNSQNNVGVNNTTTNHDGLISQEAMSATSSAAMGQIVGSNSASLQPQNTSSSAGGSGNIISSRFYKDSTRKQSQANQKRRPNLPTTSSAASNSEDPHQQMNNLSQQQIVDSNMMQSSSSTPSSNLLNLVQLSSQNDQNNPDSVTGGNGRNADQDQEKTNSQSANVNNNAAAQAQAQDKGLNNCGENQKNFVVQGANDTRNFLSILNQKEFSDITLLVEGKPIYCHQVILASRSTYFEASFTHDFAEKEQRVATFNDVPYDFFLLFLRHIYSDSVKVEPKYIYELLSLADRFNVPSFKKRCEQILAQHISIESVCQIFKYANTFNCERLRETCLLFTEENHEEVISSEGFEDLDKDEILKIIKLGNDARKSKKHKK